MTKQFHVYTHENEIATVVKCHFSSKHLQAANWSYKNMPVKQMAERTEQHRPTLMPM